MKVIGIINRSKPCNSTIYVKACTAFLCKFMGLMLAKPINEDQGIIFIEATESILSSSIHMFFMRFDICVVWINREMQIVDIKLARKWHPFYAPQKPACYTLEIHRNQFENFSIGDHIELMYE